MGVKTIWELCLFKIAPLVSFQGLQTGYLLFGQKETGAERVAMATPLRVSVCFFCDSHLWCQVSRTLRRNPPDVGVTSGQKPCTKTIYIVLQTSVGLF